MKGNLPITATPWFVFCFAIFFLFFTAVSHAPAQKEQRIAILFITHPQPRYIVSPPYLKELDEKGYEVGYCTFEDLTWEKLSKFNVVVADEYDDAFYTQTAPLIGRFLNEGGGVMLYSFVHEPGGSGGRSAEHYIRLNDFLKQYGAKVLFQDIIENDSAKKQTSEMRAFMTTDIAPCIKGLPQLWYHSWTTRPIHVDSNWEDLLKGSDTAYTRVAFGLKEELADKTYPKSPLLVARRDYAEGRMVLFGGCSSPLFLDGFHDYWDNGFFFKHGWSTLLDQIYQWLGEPSLAGKKLGGFQSPQQRVLYQQPVANKAFGTKRWKAAGDSTGYAIYKGRTKKGVIGVRSSISGGKYSIENFCDEARRLGYDFLVFTEKSDAVNTESSWNDYVKRCEQMSDENFRAYPGVLFTTPSGDKGIRFYNEVLPYWKISPKEWGPLGPRTNGMTAVIQPTKNPVPYYVHGVVSGFALFTYEDGVLVDDAVDMFRQSRDIWRLHPISYCEITDPAQLENVPYAVYENQGHYFVSSGPVFTSFSATEPPCLQYTNSQLTQYKEVNLRQIDVEFEITSEVPLKKVDLYFGQRLIRSFYPNSSDFKKKVTYMTNETGHFYLEATDANGGKAFSDNICLYRLSYTYFIDTMNGYWERWYLSTTAEERQIWGGGGKHEVWAGFLGPSYRWSGNQTQVRGWIQCEPAPQGPEVDVPGGSGKLDSTALFDTTEGKEFFHSSASNRQCVLNSAQCIIMHDDIRDNRVFEKNNKTLVEKTRLIDGDVTTTGFRWHRAIMLLVDQKIEVKKDFQLKAGDGLNPLLIQAGGGSPVDNYTAAFYTSAPDAFSSGPVLTPPHEVPAGGFASFTGLKWGIPAFFSFDGGSFQIVEEFNRPTLKMGYQWNGNTFLKGAKLHNRYLFVWTPGRETEEDQQNLLKQIYDVYGFDGTPAYTISAKKGAVIESTYAPRIKAFDFCAVLDVSKAELPNPLGIMIEGLNENWDARMYDLDKNAIIEGVAIWNGTGYVTVDTASPRRLFIGSPVISDNPDIHIMVVDLSAKRVAFVIHNPAEKAVRTHCSISPGLVDDAGLPPFESDYELSPGETTGVILSLTGQNWKETIIEQ